jgi:drug/metabolite transporter (DMT)-like permease
MLTPILAILLATLGNGIHQIEGIMIKKYNSKHSKGGFIFTAILSLFAMLFFLILDLVTDRTGLCFPPEMIPYGLASGAFYCMASFLTYVAYRHGSFVLTNLFLSYSLLFSVGYGLIFLHDSLSWVAYVGLGLMMVSIFLARNSKKADADDSKKKAPKTTFLWVVCVILSVVGAGMFGVIQKLQQVQFDGACDREYMVVTLGFSALIMLVIGLIKDGKDLPYILRHGSLPAAIAGMSNGGANLVNLITNAMLPISIISPTRSGIKIIVSFLIARLIFKEKLKARQIVGVILGAAALILLNLKI